MQKWKKFFEMATMVAEFVEIERLRTGGDPWSSILGEGRKMFEDKEEGRSEE